MKFKGFALSASILLLILSNIILFCISKNKEEILTYYSNESFHSKQILDFRINNVNSLLIEDLKKLTQKFNKLDSNKFCIVIREGNCMSCIYDLFEVIKLYYGNEDDRIYLLTIFRNEQSIKAWMNAHNINFQYTNIKEFESIKNIHKPIAFILLNNEIKKVYFIHNNKPELLKKYIKDVSQVFP